MVLRGEIMGIFSSKGHIHLQGHKEETKHKEALVYQVNAQEKVYLQRFYKFPLYSQQLNKEHSHPFLHSL